MNTETMTNKHGIKFYIEQSADLICSSLKGACSSSQAIAESKVAPSRATLQARVARSAARATINRLWSSKYSLALPHANRFEDGGSAVGVG